MLLSLEALNECFELAMEKDAQYFAVAIKFDGADGLEVIINSTENFIEKKMYYNNVYDIGLSHKHADGVRIVGYTFGDSFQEIEEKIYRTDVDYLHLH